MNSIATNSLDIKRGNIIHDKIGDHTLQSIDVFKAPYGAEKMSQIVSIVCLKEK